MPHTLQNPSDIKGVWGTLKYTFYAHPFEVVIALLSVLYGVAMLLPGPAQAVPSLPPLIGWAWGVGLIACGVLIKVGLLMRTPRWEHLGRSVERAGLILGATIYASILIGAILLGSKYGSSAIQAFVITLGCLGRLRAVTKVEKVIAAAVSAREEER